MLYLYQMVKDSQQQQQQLQQQQSQASPPKASFTGTGIGFSVTYKLIVWVISNLLAGSPPASYEHSKGNRTVSFMH
jgi:hypothetical protein